LICGVGGGGKEKSGGRSRAQKFPEPKTACSGGEKNVAKHGKDSQIAGTPAGNHAKEHPPKGQPKKKLDWPSGKGARPKGAVLQLSVTWGRPGVENTLLTGNGGRYGTKEDPVPTGGPHDDQMAGGNPGVWRRLQKNKGENADYNAK